MSSGLIETSSEISTKKWFQLQQPKCVCSIAPRGAQLVENRWFCQIFEKRLVDLHSFIVFEWQNDYQGSKDQEK